MEYIAIRVRARYIGVEDPLEIIDGSFSGLLTALASPLPTAGA
jgi:hypothetical protein